MADLTEWEVNLCSIIRARQPGIVIQSMEEQRVLDSVIKVLQWMALKRLGARELVVWSPVSSRKIPINDPSKEEALEWQEFFPTLKDFRDQGADTDDAEQPRRAVLVLADCEHELNQPSALRLLRETLWAIRSTTRAVIILGKPFDIPDEIAPDLTVLPFDLPTAEDLKNILYPMLKVYKEAEAYARVKIEDNAAPQFARACAGLSEIEARGLLGLSIARFEAFDFRAVDMALREKANIVRRSNVLEYKTCAGGLQDIGGLENLKNWIKEQDDILTQVEDAKAYGLRLAKGLLLVGIPGSGKSLTAEMLAAHWRLPLLIFDVGRAFGSLVGQSEANVDQVISLAKACRPCVVFIDEIEKALGGSGGELDGGTSARVKGKLLTWLQTKPDDVFVVATANDVTKFNSTPELIRAGRFDRVFFVDLPDLRSRLEILAIHYRKAVQAAKASGKCALPEQIPADVLMEAAKISRGYSGAELEVCVQTAIRAAFNAKPRLVVPTSDMLAAAVRAQKPLSQTMKESIRVLREWCADGRALPAGATLEDDAKDSKGLEQHGLPILLSAVTNFNSAT